MQSVAPAHPAATTIVESRQTTGVEVYLGLAYVFVCYSRLPEFLASFIGTGLFLAITTLTATLTVALLKGNVNRALMGTPGILWIALTIWYVLVIPFGAWPRGSVGTLTEMWFKSLAAFFVVASAFRTFKDVQKCLFAIGSAIMFVIAMSTVFGRDAAGRFSIGQGTLANANGLASHILYGFPALMLIYAVTKGAYRFMALAALAMSAVSVLRTGSRSGLLMLMVAALMIFWRASVFNKAKLILVGGAVVTIGLSMTTEAALKRYLTLVTTSEEALGGEGASAIESQHQREHAVRQSIRLVLRHPIFGVGPGNYRFAASSDSEDRGEQAMWMNPHNIYAQVSTESGIPGLLLFLSLIAYCGRTGWRLSRVRVTSPTTSLAADIGFSVLVLTVIYALNGLFDSNAYLYHLPVFTGLCFAIRTAVAHELPAGTAFRRDDQDNFGYPVRMTGRQPVRAGARR
jgi:O-antigen ligase